MQRVSNGLRIERDIQSHQQVLKSLGIIDIDLELPKPIDRLPITIFELQGQQDATRSIQGCRFDIEFETSTDLAESIAIGRRRLFAAATSLRLGLERLLANLLEFRQGVDAADLALGRGRLTRARR